MKKENWIWMPHPGHFICSQDCQFFLNTCVGKFIVSTIGEYWPDRKVREIHAEVRDPKWLEKNIHLKGDYFDHAYRDRFGFLEISYDRTYETKVFEAVKSEHGCCPMRINVEEEVDSTRYNTAEEAYKGHLELCKKWARYKSPLSKKKTVDEILEAAEKAEGFFGD